MTVRHVFGIDDEVALCVALLHDTIEDTTTDYDDLSREFGREVAEAVACLTKDTRLPEDLREAVYHAVIAGGPWQARVVKLADAFDNVTDAHEPAILTKASAKARRSRAAGSAIAMAGAGSGGKLPCSSR